MQAFGPEVIDMVRKWKLGATGTALLATAFVVVACSSKSDDDDSNGGSGNTSAKGGTGATGGTSANAGKGGSGTGGSTGGTGGSTGGTGGSTGGSAGTGTTTGGSGGMSTGGMGAGGAATGFGCPSPTAASCNYITNWGTFTNGMFGGGLYVYGDLKQDTTDTGEFHVSGTVTTYSGFGIYFNSCTDVSAYSNVTFTVAGTSANMMASSLWYIIQQNSDEPVDSMGMKGACTGMPGNPCQSPYTQFAVSDTAQTIAFSALAGGATMAPATTDGKFDPKQAIGMQWQFRPETAQTAGYAVDVKLDNLMFGTGTVSGSGGMGSGGASSGGAPGAGASAGGKAGSSAAGAANDVVTQIECTAASMAGSGAGGSSGSGAGGSSGAASGGAPMGGQGGATGGQSNGGRGGATAGGGGRLGGGRGGQGGA
jgi:hypothetical protein